LTAASTDARWDARARERQAANLLGALTLTVSDRLLRAIAEAGGVAENDAVALSALQHILEAPRVDQLARVLGLSSSGVVRLVDRLEAAGLVRRAAAADGRVTETELTPAGRRRANAVSRARLELMEGALEVLTPAERRQLGELAGKILAGRVRPPGATRWTCRLCDLVACGRPRGRCPVYEEGKRRYASSDQ
jgi:DNA-binding MarR family transcriptional regulator